MNSCFRRALLGPCSVLSVAAILVVGLGLYSPASSLAAGHGGKSSQRKAPVTRLIASRWAARVSADHRLVARAHALRRCLHASPARCTSTRGALQQAGERFARAEGLLAAAVHRSEHRGVARAARHRALRKQLRAPVMKLKGQTLRWRRVGRVRTYIVERIVSGEAPQFYVVHGHKFTPPPAPGVTVSYTVRTDFTGSAWSLAVDVSYARPNAAAAIESFDNQAAPTLNASGETLSWGALAGVSTYILRTSVAGQAPQYTVVSATSVTPPAVAATTVSYSIRSAVNGSAWSEEVSIAYPAAAPVAPPVSETPSPPHGEGPVLLGIVGGSCCGSQVAKKVLALGFTSERLEAGIYTTDKESYENGFRNDQIIVGNVDDGSHLSSVNIPSWVNSTMAQVREAVAYGYTLLEVGNEMYLKASAPEPVKYAEMYMALAHAIDTAGIKGVTLIFDSFGDYLKPNGELSVMSNGGGWIGDALKAEPELKQRVSAFSNHPYGIPGIKYVNGDWGMEGLEAQHAQAVSLGFAHTNYYATEYGETDSAPSSLQVQAERIKWAYGRMLGLPYVRGIWYYQLHDDSTGAWGLVSGTWEPRPALAVLEHLLSAGV
jgi:hypothetical protein